MKNFFYILIFTCCFPTMLFAQTENSGCPNIKVEGPSDLINSGDTVTFKASLDRNPMNSNLSFEWNVSQGFIVDQQGTSVIRVSTTKDMAGSNLTASVKVKGLPKNCNSEAEKTAAIRDVISCGTPGRSYGKIGQDDEFSRFDNFFVELQFNVGSRGYVRFDIEKSEKTKDVQNRVTELLNHFDFREVSRNLVVFDVCYAEKHSTRLVVLLGNTSFPDIGECERVDIVFKSTL